MELTRDNYYTPEADWAYMSCSQFQSWNECEARELAILEGRWTPKETEALSDPRRRPCMWYMLWAASRKYAQRPFR